MAPIRMSTQSRKKRAPDLTPVMDVVFILVVFFLLVSTFSQQVVKPLTVTAPAGARTEQNNEQHVLELRLEATMLDGTSIAATELPAALAGMGDRPLKIVVGGGVRYQALIDALDVVQTAGIANVRVEPNGSAP